METIFQRVKRHEGFRSKPYLDTTGNYTIGFGHKISPDQAVNYANGISEQDAEDLLHSDLDAAAYEMLKNFPWCPELSSTRQGVLVELIFWIGIGGMMEFGNFLFSLRSGNYGDAAKALINSLLHTQVPARTEELANLILNDGNNES